MWAKRYNGTGNNADAATAVAVSPTGGTVYVTGQSYGPASVVDYATVAYNAATGSPAVGGPLQRPGRLNVPSSVAVSPDGKTVFVTGKSLQANTQNDYATVAYDAATGHQLWAKGYNGSLNNDDEATSVAVSPTSGTVYVTGFSWGKTTAQDYATIAYNATTGAQQWVKRYNGPPGNGPDDANSVAVSPAGTVYVTGQSFGTSASGMDYATVAYTAAGTQLWVKRYNGPGRNTDDARSVGGQPGREDGVRHRPKLGGPGLSLGLRHGRLRRRQRRPAVGQAVQRPRERLRPGQLGSRQPHQRDGVRHRAKRGDKHPGADYATIAYNAASGAQQWVARYNGTGNGTDIATSLAVSPTSGTVYVTGQSVATSGLYDYATIAYTATGIRAVGQAPRRVGSLPQAR